MTCQAFRQKKLIFFLKKNHSQKVFKNKLFFTMPYLCRKIFKSQNIDNQFFNFNFL